MSQHGLTLREFIEHCRGQSLEPWQIEVLEALDPDNTTHEEDPMTYEKNLYPQPRPQAACPPQTSGPEDEDPCPAPPGGIGQPHRTSQLDEALGTTHGLTDTLEAHVSRLEDALDEHLLPEPEGDGAKDYPQPRDDTRTTKAREVDAANNRLQRLCRRLESIMNRLEC